VEAFNYLPNKKNLTILFLVSLIIKLIVFVGFIVQKERYKQPDSMDYHHCAMALTSGRGMYRLDNNRPMFWRTPGYPLYLSWFYGFFGIKSLNFSDNNKAQITSIVVQIIINSLLTILIFFLAFTLTKSLAISWVTAWISTFHPGFILTSTYLLTEGLALFFIIPYFLFFYKSFGKNWIKNIVLAAIFLGIFTWIRPMGQFVSIASIMIILILDKTNWKTKFKKITLFFLLFLSLISGWYIRNYKITDRCFFCPMFGLYLNTFNAPKIIRETTGITLRESIKQQYYKANKIAKQEYLIAKAKGKDLATELVHLKAALPVVLQHPFIFIKDWMKETAKTTFDLYSSQIVEFAKNTFHYDPPEEFLTEKIAECLYKQKMSPLARCIVYIELIFEILKWIGLLAGAFLFLIYPIFKKFNVSNDIKQTGLMWIKISPIIAAFLVMTGGFGYARLRLPVESLMIILSLTFWYWILKKNSIK